MKRQPNKAAIGAFIIGGIIAFIAILIIGLGLFHNNRGRDMYVMYFHESINGLSIGSPVVLKGVEVGKVTKIEIVPDTENYSYNIPVYITFNNMHDIILAVQSDRDLTQDEIVRVLIDKGLHAKLVNQNLLTGQMMIELDITPAKTTMTRGEIDGIYEIPTTLSSLSEIQKNVQDIPFQEVVENLNSTLLDLKDVLNPAVKVSNDLSKRAATTINNFNQAIEDVSRAANSIRNLADFLEQHPDSLIRGKRGDR